MAAIRFTMVVSALFCGWNQNDPGRLTLSISSHMLPRQLLTANRSRR